MGKKINRFRPYARVLLGIWVILIIVLAILPELPLPSFRGKPIQIRLDYLAHFLEHTLLAFLAIISFVTSLSELRAFRITLIALVLFAAFTELLQIMIPDRTFEYNDLALNISGIFIGTIIAILSIREKRR